MLVNINGHCDLQYKYSSYSYSICIYILYYYIWLVVDLPLCKMMEFVSWDDEIPNMWKKKHVPNQQLVLEYSKCLW